MRHIVFVCVLLLCIQYSLQVPKYENCDRQVLQGDAAKDCVKVTCAQNKKGYTLKGCDSVRCRAGKQVGYHPGNRNEEYPECCDYPICSR